MESLSEEERTKRDLGLGTLGRSCTGEKCESRENLRERDDEGPHPHGSGFSKLPSSECIKEFTQGEKDDDPELSTTLWVNRGRYLIYTGQIFDACQPRYIGSFIVFRIHFCLQTASSHNDRTVVFFVAFAKMLLSRNVFTRR